MASKRKFLPDSDDSIVDEGAIRARRYTHQPANDGPQVGLYDDDNRFAPEDNDQCAEGDDDDEEIVAEAKWQPYAAGRPRGEYADDNDDNDNDTKSNRGNPRESPNPEVGPSVPPPPVPSPPPAAPHEPNSDNSPAQSQRRDQSASKLLQPFIAIKSRIERLIFRTKTHTELNQLCTCPSERPTEYRCQDCFFGVGRMFCRKCVWEEHRLHPTHRLLQWNGKTFVRPEPETIREQHVIHLGHNGNPCPQWQPHHPSHSMIVLDVTGIFECTIRECPCWPEEEDNLFVNQLLKHRLFPSTLERPRTVYTFALLDHYQQVTMSTNISAERYYDILMRTTDPVFPQRVKERVDELSRAARVYSLLTDRRRSGQAFNIDRHLPHRQKGCLVLRCPSCPEIGFNVEEVEIAATSEDERYIYTLFLSVDGNFRLTRKKKNHDPADTAQNHGKSHFPHDPTFRTYLDGQTDGTTETSCSKFKAVRNQNVSKFKNLEVTGVVGIMCARHGFYMPEGMVDLEKGESYNRTDYALARALQHVSRPDLQKTLLTYDIWCQYHVNLVKRFETNEHLSLSLAAVKNLTGAVPKMHLVGHVPSCQIRHSLNYMEGVGLTYGEYIESGWSVVNAAAAVSQQQNPGLRHEYLSGVFGYCNWIRLIALPDTLATHYRNRREEKAVLELSFKKLSESFSAKDLTAMAAMDTKPTQIDGKWTSVYEKSSRDLPTLEATCERLLAREAASAKAKKVRRSAVLQISLISEALDLEARQAMKRQDDDDQETDQLGVDLEKWRRKQLRVCPAMASNVELLDPGFSDERDLEISSQANPYEVKLFLPSSLSKGIRDQLELDKVTNIEYELRVAQAYEALDQIRDTVTSVSLHWDEKRKDAQGQTAQTRYLTRINELNTRARVAANTYRRAYQALRALGIRDGERELQELDNSQLKRKRYHEPQRLGEARQPEAWYWSIGRREGISDEDWQLELDRVQWHRDRAALWRTKEELKLLDEELRRMTVSFDKYTAIWTSLGEEQEADAKRHAEAKRHSEAEKHPERTVPPRHDVPPGESVYCHQRANVFSRLAGDCRRIIETLRLENQKEGMR